MSFVGDFQMEVLRTVAAMQSARYGAKIHHYLEMRLDRTIEFPQTYKALDRLEELGLLSSWTAESSDGKRGRPRRHYCITQTGQNVIAAWAIIKPPEPDLPLDTSPDKA